MGVKGIIKRQKAMVDAIRNTPEKHGKANHTEEVFQILPNKAQILELMNFIEEIRAIQGYSIAFMFFGNVRNLHPHLRGAKVIFMHHYDTSESPSEESITCRKDMEVMYQQTLFSLADLLHCARNVPHDKLVNTILWQALKSLASPDPVPVTVQVPESMREQLQDPQVLDVVTSKLRIAFFFKDLVFNGKEITLVPLHTIQRPIEDPPNDD